MPETLFDQNNPFEKQISERLDEYLNSGLNHDQVLYMIGRDFPYMDSDVRERCENAAFVHRYTTDGGSAAATYKRIALLHSKSKDDPFYTHLGSMFYLKNGDDLYVAVLVENPMYLHEKAEVHLTFHVDSQQVNEFRHTMAIDERRKVFYIPLNILETVDCRAGCNSVTIVVIDENIKGHSYSIVSDIYYGETEPSDVFSPNEITIGDDYNCADEDVFDIDSTEDLYLHASINHTEDYGPIYSIEGIVTISPSDSTDRSETIVKSICLRNSSDIDGLLECSDHLFTIWGMLINTESVPYFTPEPGKYTVNLYVLDKLLWSKEIEFVDPSKQEIEDEIEEEDDCISESDDLDALLDNYMMQINLDPEVDPFDHIEVIGLNLYNISYFQDDNDRCLDIMSSLPQTSFAADRLKMLSVIGKLKVHKDTDLLNRNNLFKWILYDQTGRMVDCKSAKKDTINDELWICAGFGDFCNQNWSKGSYRVELKWQESTVINASFTIGDIDIYSDYDPKLICRRDNTIQNAVEGSAIARLEKMAGLKEVKEKVHSMMNFHKLQQKRAEAGLPVKQPCLHARFLGNPGTGKTTVARLLGQIYKEMGILSSGHVVLEERKNMIGRYYDSEGQAVDNALNRAKGGILLIDEAYNLYVESDDKDPGRRILECLLTALSDENNRDWMLILAGYPKEMEKMLESNPGLESRVSEKFYFDDLSEDELLQVAQLYCDDNKYELSEQARERLKAVITRDVAAKDKNFGNGRYVNKLMETAINTRMASRLSKIDSPTYDQLVTIEADDIPIDPEEAKRISSKGFDDAAIDEALKRLDSLVGLGKVKSAIHNFVNISRFLNSQGDRFRGKGLLKWNFTGNTGTGKSTVAQILADILKAMNLIQNNELTEVKGEEIFNVSDYTCNEVIRDAVKRSRRGLLFIDGDAPEFRSSQYRMTGEQIRFKLASLASDESASGAVVIAECSTSNLSIAHSLASNGIYDFDHTFIFDDYSADELYSILLQCLDKQDTTVSEGAEAILREYINNLCANRELSFANARTMKNLSRAIFETVILRMTREAAQGDRVVLAEDVESFVWKKISSKIGFQ